MSYSLHILCDLAHRVDTTDFDKFVSRELAVAVRPHNCVFHLLKFSHSKGDVRIVMNYTADQDLTNVILRTIESTLDSGEKIADVFVM